MFVIERFRVADYETWKSAFDAHVDARIRHGAVGHKILRDEENENHVTVMLEFTNRGGAISLEQYDVTLLDVIRRGGIVGGPHQASRSVDYLDVVDEADYTGWPYA
jgi:hypothetical protein